MRHMGKWAMVAGLGLGLVACKEDAENAGGAGANIIAVVPLTGSFAATGLNYQQAFQQAIEDLGTSGIGKEVGGFTLNIIDSGPGRDAVNTAVTEAINASMKGDKHNVALVLSATLAAMQGSLPPAMDFKIPNFEVAWGGGADEVYQALWPDSPTAAAHNHDISYAFNARPLCDPEAELTAEFLESKWTAPAKTMIVRGTNVHDIKHASVIRSIYELHGKSGQLLNAEDVVAPYAATGEPINYSATATAIVTANPDVVFFHVTGDDQNLKFVEALKAANYTGKIVTCGMARSLKFIDPAQNGNMSEYMAGKLHFVMRGPPLTGELTQFKDDYKAKWNADAITFTPAGYDALVLSAMAMAIAGEPANGELVKAAILGASKGGELVKYKELSKALGFIKAGTDINYDGPSGTLDIDETEWTIPNDMFVEEVWNDGGTYKYRTLTDPARQTRQ